MDRLRLPLFIVALVLIVLTFLLEIGSNSLALFLSAFFDSDTLRNAAQAGEIPGIAIGYLALFDGLMVYTVMLIGLPLVITHSVHGRLQGFLTFVISLLVIVACIILLFAAISKLMIMVGLLFSPIFGTIAYFSLFSNFPRTSSKIILSTLMIFKLGFAACLVFAHQRFLQNTSLIFLILFSLLLGILTSFLHTIVPGFLVSITDAIAAIIIGVVALVWAVLYFVVSIQSVLKAI